MIQLPDFSGLRVHVIGDAIRDVYVHAKALGMASKSPTLVYELGKRQEWIGGVGVVAAHCEAAGADVTITRAGETIKERIVVEGVKVAEFHKPSRVTASLPHALRAIDVAIYADFGHGVFTQQTTHEWLAMYPDAVTAADSQTTDICWGNILDFAGCDLLFANEREARFALRDQETKDIGSALWEAARKGGSTAALLKLGHRGLRIYREEDRVVLPAYAQEPITDPIGAGDALLAYATLTYAVTKDLALAGQVGSLAAAEACAHEGNVPVTREAVKARAKSLG